MCVCVKHGILAPELVIRISEVGSQRRFHGRDSEALIPFHETIAELKLRDRTCS